MADIPLETTGSTIDKPAFRLVAILERLASSTRFAYGTLLLLQLKVVWGMWLYRDLPWGDTGYYFARSLLWYTSFRGSIAWSPLYTGFYGSLMNLSPDAYFVTTLHRLIIIFVASTLVLALMRRLLPHSAAWLIAAWWVISPVTFDALYEVHLFAVIPTTLAYLVVLYKPTIWTRGAALGIFLVSGTLSRNEIMIAAGLWALLCLGWEIYQARKRGMLPVLTYLRAYGIPMLLAAILVGFFYWRATEQFPKLSEAMSNKHTRNVCQVYSFNYQQRDPSWSENPFASCSNIMMQHFGAPQPSMTEAIRLNPQAMLDFFQWNLHLIPDGIQVLLFNATSGTGQPDYITRITGSPYPTVLGMLAIAVVVVGGWLIRRNGWWNLWIKPRIWGWLALSCVVVVMGFVMLTQRPRPSYLYNLFLFLTAVIGLCGAAIVDRVVGLKRFKLAFPAIAIALIIIVPPYFTPTYRNPSGYTGRYLMEAYRRLAPYQSIYATSDIRFLGAGWIIDICNYAGNRECVPLDYRAWITDKPADLSLADWLAQENIDLFYVDESIIASPDVQAFLQNSDREGWDMLVSVQTDSANWRLLRRR